MLPIDAHIVSVSEDLSYFNLEEMTSKVTAIHTVYLYDKNQHTFLCEMTPSYYLLGLYMVFTYTEEFQSRVFAEESLGMEGIAGDSAYAARETLESEMEQPEPIYMHVSDVDAITSRHACGKTGVSYDDADYDEQMESLREHYECNRAF